MDTTPGLARMQALVARLNETAYAYYVLDNPIISDSEWDALYDELTKLEHETGTQLPESPTRRVGAEPVAAFAPHRHIRRLWSMDKAQTEQSLTDWATRADKLRIEAIAGGQSLPALSYAVEYKLDGLSLNLTYEGGVLVQAATRGNGVVGEAILPQVQTIRSIPLAIPFKGRMEVRGEGVMRLSVLAAYNRTAAEPLKNARNGAAGALRNLSPRVTAERRLDAFFYHVGYIEGETLSNHAQMLAFLRENGIPVSPFTREVRTIAEAMDAVREIEAARETLDFLIDGAVIKITDFATREALGYTDKFPRWEVAYKFKAEEATTRLLRVTWELGRTGKLTPLAHVEPVELGGATVSRATLNNWDDIVRKDVRIGAEVFIRRSNDVIPEIMGRVPGESPDEMPVEKPERCPACGAVLVPRGAHIFCENRECRPQRIARLAHFAGRDAMDIETFSEKTAELLCDEVGVRDAADLYALTPERLHNLPGFKEKKAQNLLKALDASKSRPLDAFLFALGIPNVGRKTARDLAQRYGTIENVQAATAEELTAMQEVGDIVASSIVDFFADETQQALVRRLLAAGVSPAPVSGAAADGVFAGQTVVITGVLKGMGRKEAEDAVAARGGAIGSSVTKKTTLVVAGEAAGSKLAKAQQLQVPVIDEEAFMQMLGATQ